MNNKKSTLLALKELILYLGKKKGENISTTGFQGHFIYIQRQQPRQTRCPTHDPWGRDFFLTEKNCFNPIH